MDERRRGCPGQRTIAVRGSVGERFRGLSSPGKKKRGGGGGVEHKVTMDSVKDGYLWLYLYQGKGIGAGEGVKV